MSCFLAAELLSSSATKLLVRLARAALQEPSWTTLAPALDWTKSPPKTHCQTAAARSAAHTRQWPLLAISGYRFRRQACLLLGVKRTLSAAQRKFLRNDDTTTPIRCQPLRRRVFPFV